MEKAILIGPVMVLMMAARALDFIHRNSIKDMLMLCVRQMRQHGIVPRDIATMTMPEIYAGTILLSVIIVCLMIGALSTQSVFAKKHHLTVQEVGIPSDTQGILCTFGPNHDLCKDTELQGRPCTGIVGSPNYDDCVYSQGFKTGHNNAIKRVYDHSNDPDTTWAGGYSAGWHQGCLDSGRSADDCSAQENARTP